MDKIGYGLCCICLALKEKGVSYKKMTAKSFFSMPRADALEKLSAICLNNAAALFEIVKFCGDSGMAHYRIPSDIFPLITLERAEINLQSLPHSAEISTALKKAAEIIRSSSVGVSFHPSQFIVPASSRADVRSASAAEINFNAEILDVLQTEKSRKFPINIHMNSNPCRDGFVDDFEDGLAQLGESARARLVIENEDRGHWCVSALADFLKPYGIPITFDFLHHKCNGGGMSERAAFFAAAQTWGDCTPIFHYAESVSEKTPRSHSEYCKNRPPYFGLPYVCQIEAKAKDFAIKRLMQSDCADPSMPCRSA